MKSTKPAVTIICQDFYPIEGGLTTWVYNLALELTKLDHEVEVLTRRWKDLESDDSKYPFSVHRLPTEKWKNRKNFRIYRYLKKISQNNKPTVIICGNWKMGVPVRWFNIWHRRKKFPYIVCIHGMDVYEFRRLNRNLLRKTINDANLVITGSIHVREKIIELHNYRRKISIVHYGVDINRFKPMDIPTDLFEKYNIPINKKILLSVSRLVERKGFDNVIRTLPQVIDKFDDFLYVIGGRGKDERRLRNLTHEFGVEEHVRFIGFVHDDDLPGIYNISDVFIMPSREINGNIEGFGIAYLEANACKKPVIGGNSGGIPDAVEDGVSGILVNPESLSEIANAIIKLFSDEILYAKLSHDGFRRVYERFLWHMIAEKHSEHIMKIIEQL
jgi:phosphatidylinositol alpha-1,6-mannosyltransferase